MLFKRLFSVCLVPYALWLVLFYRYHFVDGANLFIHEAGHMVFLPLGQTLHVIGGTFWQLAFPAIVAGYFWWRRQRYESAVGCLWLGESLMYTAVYLGDAMAMKLPLVGGHIHDWNWLLYRMGLLGQCENIAWGLHGIASGMVLLGVVYVVFDAFGLFTKLGFAPRRDQGFSRAGNPAVFTPGLDVSQRQVIEAADQANPYHLPFV